MSLRRTNPRVDAEMSAGLGEPAGRVRGVGRDALIDVLSPCAVWVLLRHQPISRSPRRPCGVLITRCRVPRDEPVQNLAGIEYRWTSAVLLYLAARECSVRQLDRLKELDTPLGTLQKARIHLFG